MYIWMNMDAWKGRRIEEIEFESRKGAIVFPEVPTADGRWAVYMEYFGAFPETAQRLLDEGYYIVYLANRSRWIADDDQPVRLRFFDYLEEKYELNHRAVLIGMSCGGLHALSFATQHPERVSAMYLDAPVVQAAIHNGDSQYFTPSACVGLVERLPVLAQNHIPIVMLYGENDVDVPYRMNGRCIETLYAQAGSDILIYAKPNGGHHPHGLKDPSLIVDYILENAL